MAHAPPGHAIVQPGWTIGGLVAVTRPPAAADPCWTRAVASTDLGRSSGWRGRRTAAGRGPTERRGYTPGVGLTRIIIGGVSLVAAALIVPGIQLEWGDEPTRTIIVVAVLAILFGVINAYIKPVLRVVSLPVNLLSMGLTSFVVNAGLLLLLAWLVGQVWEPVLHLGDFPPTLDVEALTAAVAGSVVISIVTTILSVLTPG